MSDVLPFDQAHGTTRLRLPGVFGLLVCLSACGNSEPAWQGPTAATLGVQEVLSNKAYLEQDRYRMSALDYGERLSEQCQKCHTLGRGEAHNKGPNLYGFMGQAAAGQSDFPYSDALSGSDFRWTPRALDAWLSAPKGFLPGNDMKFSGLSDPGSRAALIAYLLTITDDASPPD